MMPEQLPTQLPSPRQNIEFGYLFRMDLFILKATFDIDFTIEDPGIYKLRVTTIDLAWRTAVAWKTITVKK
jgi:hypothetical protein